MKIQVKINYHTVWGENLVLCISGKKYPLAWNEGGVWTGEFARIKKEDLADYHYEVVENGSVKRREWRGHSADAGDKKLLVLEDQWIDRPADAFYYTSPFEKGIWKRPESGQFRAAGVAIPVFSLRSVDDFGTGEFYDLKKMVDWAVKTGQKLIQLLPVNDTTMTGKWTDSYPYNANSTFALHPQFINLEAVGITPDPELKAELNALPQVDYERVNAAKREYLEVAFRKSYKKLSSGKAYKCFYEKNSHWLLPYAVFCAIRDEKGTPEFGKWGRYAKCSKTKIKEYYEEHPDQVNFYCFVQYHLDRQLKEVCDYAHSNGVVLKGDLPIGISRTSVDAWLYPELFNMDSSAGAPPDAFSADGQNWGFPTYNWEKMAEDGYAWWKSRMGKMSEYFDAFRIDHILGFFRIWEIPVTSVSGLDGYFNPALPYTEEEIRNLGFSADDKELFIEDPHKKGYFHPRIGAKSSRSYSILDAYRVSAFNRLYEDFFYHRHNQFWKESAMKKLPALLDSTGMLACGEDLGMIPASVPEVMRELQILSLEIQRMPKSVHETFADPAHYPYLSVCTTSTHDMNPIRAWWEEDRELTAKYFHEALHHGENMPYFCEPWVCKQIVAEHLASPAMLTVLPLQDYLAMDGAIRLEDPGKERINVPAESRHYWRYRMHLSLEDLNAQDEFNALLREMIHCYSR